MGDEVKKISFGFSKLSKKTSIISTQIDKPYIEKNDVEFIECLEGNSIKLKDSVKLEEKVLVIPLKRQVQDVSNVQKVVTVINVDEGNKQTSEVTNLSHDATPNNSTANNSRTVSTVENINNDHKPAGCVIPIENHTKSETLDEIAAREILEDLDKNKTEEEARIFTVPLTSNAPSGEKESSLEDYESIPVGDFGMAMLRGMGWAPGKGIGKNEKLITPSLPKLRPKGMGLGADKFLKVDNEPNNEDLKMAKGSFVRVKAGPYKDSYGQIEGLDDESGRVIVKLAVGSISVSLNEFMIHLVDKVEFNKNSKVINVSKYEQYKDDEFKKYSGKTSQETLNKEEKQQVQNTSSKPSINKSIKKKEKGYNEPKYSETMKIKQHSSSSENESFDRKRTPYKVKETPHLTKSSNVLYKKRSRSSSGSPCDTDHKTNRKSRSLSKSDINLGLSYTTSDGSLCASKQNSHKDKSVSKQNMKFRSRSSDSSSSDYSKLNKQKSSKKRGSLVKERSGSTKSSRQKSGSNCSDSSSSLSNFSKKDKRRTKKKKPSSHKKRSRSRSRSPRKHSSHKKHKRSR